MTYNVSPGVYSTEQNLTTALTAASSSIGAFSGYFKWGPVEQPVLCASELDLVNNFLSPDIDTQTDFLTAASFLAYTSALWVSRVYNPGTIVDDVLTGGALNATTAQSATAGSEVGTGVLIKNADAYTTVTIPSSANWVAKYCGSAGNNLRVYNIASSNAFTDLKSRAAGIVQAGTTQLDLNIYNQMVTAIGRGGVNTTTYAATYNSFNDEMSIFVVDYTGFFTGAPGTILESWIGLSQIQGAVGSSGASLYYVDVINAGSQYIWWGNHATSFGAHVGLPVIPNTNYYSSGLQHVFDYAFGGGSDGAVNVAAITAANYIAANSFFASKETYNISLLFVTATATGEDSVVALDAIQNIAEVRKDCVVFISPPIANVVGNADPLDNVIGYRSSALFPDYVGDNTLGGYSTSYAVLDCNWKYMYNKYANTFVWIPLCGDIAGLCAQTDALIGPWASPAGFNRGLLKNVVKLAWNPNETQRDDLYTNNVNPVVSFPGTGPLLYGDKTLDSKPSAFNRINVRRLFIVLEVTIGLAAQYSLFQNNNQFTRAQFVSLITPYLQQVQGQNGITSFKVVCDTSNNTPAVINANQFIGAVYIVPQYSINFIQLQFVAVPNGVDFQTIIGQS